MHAIEFNQVWKKFKKGDKVYSLRDAIPRLMQKVFSQKGCSDGAAEREASMLLVSKSKAEYKERVSRDTNRKEAHICSVEKASLRLPAKAASHKD